MKKKRNTQCTDFFRDVSLAWQFKHEVANSHGWVGGVRFLLVTSPSGHIQSFNEWVIYFALMYIQRVTGAVFIVIQYPYKYITANEHLATFCGISLCRYISKIRIEFHQVRHCF
jgi:hypothetical protein